MFFYTIIIIVFRILNDEINRSIGHGRNDEYLNKYNPTKKHLN